MRKPKYIYNPEADNFERIYPSFRNNVLNNLKYISVGIFTGLVVFWGAWGIVSSRNSNDVEIENAELKARYRQLSGRVEDALKVLEDISVRDDNFYRSILQTEPLNKELRNTTSEDIKLNNGLINLSSEELMDELDRRTNLLEHQIYVQSLSFDELRDVAADYEQRIKRIPSVIPLPSLDYPISCGYGYRRDPARGVMKMHEGIDWAVSYGTRVVSPADGIVTKTGRNGINGIFIELDHGYNYTTHFYHLGNIVVKEGQVVEKGETIGYTGSTGKSVGPHLHYEVRYKKIAQNPVDYFFGDLSPRKYEKMLREAENAAVALD